MTQLKLVGQSDVLITANEGNTAARGCGVGVGGRRESGCVPVNVCLRDSFSLSSSSRSVCVRACVRARARACVRACDYVCVRLCVSARVWCVRVCVYASE